MWAFVRYGLLTIAAVVGLFSSASADDTWSPTGEGWSRYRNERFGTLAEVPLHLFKLVEPPPTNGDGREFKARDGAGLSVSGSYGPHVVTDTFQDYKAWLLKETELDGISYKAEGPTWLVLSGTKGANIVYIKVVEGCGAAHELHMEYPAARKKLYDFVVARVSRSLGCTAVSTSHQ